MDGNGDFRLMAKVILQVGHNPDAYNFLAGNHNDLYYFDQGSLEIEIPKVGQAAMDAALVDYTANQVARDAAFIQLQSDTERDRIRDTFDDKERRLLRAFAEVVKDEINILRGQHALAPRTLAQLRTAIRNKVS